MKKMFLGLALLLTVSLFGAKNVQNDNNPLGNEDACTLTRNVKNAPEATVWGVDYYDDGKIQVTVRVLNTGNRTGFRVKVTPTSQVTGVVVEGALYCNCNTNSNGHCEGNVTFHCKVGKEGEAAYCSAYKFVAEVID